jgi:hypothetical protein
LKAQQEFLILFLFEQYGEDECCITSKKRGCFAQFY